MSLSIAISNDNGKPFLPGSMVLGVVKLLTHEDQHIGDLAINFSGRASVLLIHSYGDMTTSRRDYKSVGYLFSQHLNLYQGKYTHRKGSYMWPFAFQIPLVAATRALPSGSKDYFQPEYPWKYDHSVEHHSLPPTMVHSGPFICTVEYRLQATLTQSCRTSRTLATMSLAKSQSIIKHVTVQSLAEQQELDGSRDWPYSKYRHNVTCTPSGSRRTILQRLRSVVGGSQRRLKSIILPKMELHISVLMPKRIILKDRTALSVIVAASSHPTKASDSPNETSANNQLRYTSLMIRSFKLSLVQHVQVRAGCHRALSDRKMFVRKGTCTVPLLAQSPLRQGPSEHSSVDNPPTSSVNLADAADLIVPTASLVPDFSTYNIVTSHSLELQFKMEYESTRFKICLRKIPLQVVSSESDRDSPSDVTFSEISGRRSASDESWIVPPPSDCDDYDDVFNALSAEPPPRYAR